MKLIISPAKSLDFESNVPTSSFSQACFLEQAKIVHKSLVKKTPKQLTQLMNISEKLAQLNWERNQNWIFIQKLGLVETRRYDNEKGKFTLVFLAAPEDLEQAKTKMTPVLELTYNWETEEYSKGRNFGHLAYSVTNIYDACQNLMDSGVTILRPPRDGRMAFIKSPDGISIELLQQKEALAPQEPWASMKNTGEW